MAGGDGHFGGENALEGRTGGLHDLDAWRDFDIVERREPGGSKWSRIERGILPLAPRVSGRVVTIREYGDAIVPQVGAVFVRAFLAVAVGEMEVPNVE